MYSVLAFDFRVLSSVGGVEERVRGLMAPFGARRATAEAHEFVVQRRGPFVEVMLDGTVAHRSRHAGSAIDWILWKASAEALARIDDLILIHAGAVAWRGRAVLLPAPPDSGKTTLAAALTAAGFAYLSDEAAPIDPFSRRVVPFPRALWLESASVEALDRFLANGEGERVRRNGTSHVAPGDLRRGRVGAPVRIRHIVFPRYTEGARTELIPLSRAEGVVEIGRNAFNLDTFGSQGIDVLASVVRGADVHRLSVGDLGTAVEAISALVGKDVPSGTRSSRNSRKAAN
jgi:hypothetical protein